jgi:hypothetical protein
LAASALRYLGGGDQTLEDPLMALNDRFDEFFCLHSGQS